MPSQAANLTALRADGHQRNTYLSVMTGTAVLTATVSATPSNPDDDIAITIVSGSAASVKVGMRVVIETSGGAYKGTLHVRAAGTISSTNIPVREFSQAFVKVASGDTLIVYDDWYITDKLTSATSTFAPDNIAYTDQGSNPPPVVCSGGWWAGWLGSGGTVAIPFTGDTSYNLDPDTADTLTHSWSTSGGTFDNSAIANPTLTIAAAGKYLVTHTVTAANSKSRTQYIRIRVHDENDPPYEIVMPAPPTGDAELGWTCGVQLYEDASLDDIPDGAPVVVWIKEMINATTQSFGAAASGRSHIKCAGYLRRDTSAYVSSDGVHLVTFDIVSPLARLSELPGFSKAILYEASPDAWNEIKSLTVKRAMAQIVAFYTNLIEAGFDFIFDASFPDKTYSGFYLQKTTPIEQLRELADAVDSVIRCDRTGRLIVQRFLPYVPLASRGATTVTLALTTADLIEYDMTREHYRPTETFRCRGFTAGSSTSSNAPVFARWTGAAPGMGAQSDTAERLIVDSISDLYTRTGLRGAWNDKVYIDSDGVQRHAPSMTVRLPGSYDVFDFYHEYVEVDFSGNLRGVDPGDFLWFVESVSYENNEGTGATVLRLQAATAGEAGVDDPQPDEQDNNLPDFTLSDLLWDFLPFEPIPAPTTPVATKQIATFGAAGYLVRTNNFDNPSASGGPTWEQLSLGTLGTSGTYKSFTVDPFSSLYLATGSTVDGWIATGTGIYKIADIFATTPTVTLQHTFATAVGNSNGDYRILQSSRGTQNWVMCVSTDSGEVNFGTKVAYTTDGSTWTEVTINTNNNTVFFHYFPVIHLSEYTDGTAWVGVFTSASTGAIYKTTNYGASWSAWSPAATVGVHQGGWLHSPYASMDGTFFYTNRTGAGANALIRRVGGVETNVSPAPNFGVRTRRSIHSLDANQNIVAAIVTNDSDDRLYTSADGGVTWTQRQTGFAAYESLFVGSATYHIYWGNNAIAVSLDGGVTIDSRVGTGFGSPSLIDNICGGI